MNFRTAILPGQLGRKPLLAFLFLVFGAFAAYKAAGFVINDDLQGLAFVALAAIAGTCVIAMLNNWRNGLYLFLTWLLFRGLFMWTFINAIATSVAFIWGAPWRQGEVVRVLRTVQRLAVGMVLAVALLFVIFPEQLGSRLALYSETLLPSSAASDLSNRTWDYPIQNFLNAFNSDRWPYGYGIGTASLGTQYVARFFKAKLIGFAVESGFGTIVVEVGVVGLVLWFLMSGTMVFSGWKIVKKLRGSPAFPLGFIIFWYSIVLLFALTYSGMQAYEDFLLNAYLWLLLGVLFRLPSIGVGPEAPAEPAARSSRPWMR